MIVHVRLFAAIRETLGRESIDLTFAEGATAEDVWRELTRLDAKGARRVGRSWRTAAEGLVAKDESSPYVPGAHTRRWVKVKHRIRTGWPGEVEEYTRG